MQGETSAAFADGLLRLKGVQEGVKGLDRDYVGFRVLGCRVQGLRCKV